MRRKPLPMWVWWWATAFWGLGMLVFYGTTLSCKAQRPPVYQSISASGWISRTSAVPWNDKPFSVCDWLPDV